MALDKVVDSAALDAGMTIVADAIRVKAGTTESLMWPDGFKAAVEGISGATDVTDSIVSVAFSSTDSNMARIGFEGIAPEDAKITIFILQGDQSNSVNNQCLLAFLNRLYNSDSHDGRLLYCRWRNSSYNFQTISSVEYDLIVNAGDTFRMVALK